ncbi:Succinate--CoA ligase [GDP-forming] subunit beta, mitochondrial [Varanus komodoensis]|nr:Succinate--CoA ligase [GDP-forming] subunit beta, mitochondrial [Varanus komodoensis]
MRVKEESAKVGLKLNIKKTKIMASGPLTSWQIDGEEMEVVTDFIFLGSKITTDGNCSQEIKRRMLLGRKAMANLDTILKSRDITLPTKVHIVKAMVFPIAIAPSVPLSAGINFVHFEESEITELAGIEIHELVAQVSKGSVEVEKVTYTETDKTKLLMGTLTHSLWLHNLTSNFILQIRIIKIRIPNQHHYPPASPPEAVQLAPRRWLNLQEYQSKKLMADHGVTVQRFFVADTANDALEAAKRLMVAVPLVRFSIHHLERDLASTAGHQIVGQCTGYTKLEVHLVSQNRLRTMSGNDERGI